MCSGHVVGSYQNSVDGVVERQRGLLMNRILIAAIGGLALLSAGAYAPARADCTQTSPINPCVPGGGSKTNDCVMEWQTTPVPTLQHNGIPARKLVCYEGDPSCDFDNDLTNGSCTFHTALCINNHDPRLSSCTASSVLAFEVKRPNPRHLRGAADTANLAALENQAGAGGFGVTVRRGSSTVFSGNQNSMQNLCSGPLDIVVPIGGKLLRVLTTGTGSPSGTESPFDSDALSLRCRRSTCGDGIIQPWETCDDGNRDNGDGCDQGCHIETGPTRTPTETPTATLSPTPTNTPDPSIVFLQPGGGTSGSCRGTCVGGTSPGAACINDSGCGTGGTCPNRVCVGGPLNGSSCSTGANCAGCVLNPLQGSCALVQTAALPIRVPLNGVCVPRTAPDVSCLTDAECPAGTACQLPHFQALVGPPDGNQEATVTIPQSSVVFNAAILGPPVGTVCVSAAGDGFGVIDCDGGRSGLNVTVSRDHNTTPGDVNNSGPLQGFPDDPTCTATFVEPDSSVSYACVEGTKQCVGGTNAGTVCTVPGDCDSGVCDLCNANFQHAGICNSPNDVVTSGTFGSGDLQVVLPLSIVVLGTNAATYGPDNLPCTADDLPPSPLAAVPVTLSTGTTAVNIYDASNGKICQGGTKPGQSCTSDAQCTGGGTCVGRVIGPGFKCPEPVGSSCLAQASGAALSCANLAGGMHVGLKLGGGFAALDQPQVGDIVTTFQFVGQ